MIARLAVEAATTFVIGGCGRILRENDPDGSPAPRVFLTGSADGNLVFVRHDVGDDTAAAVAATVASARPWFDPASDPACLAAVVAILEREAPVTSTEASLSYALPHAAPSEGRFVRSETEAGDRLLAGLRREGLPRRMTDAGFLGVGDFWAPWCIALEGGEIAAIAFAARLTDAGAAVGVYTFSPYRGRGLAAAVTAEWSSLPALASRELFYGTLVTNTSSQRVAARLGLEPIGMTLRIA